MTQPGTAIPSLGLARLPMPWLPALPNSTGISMLAYQARAVLLGYQGWPSGHQLHSFLEL